MTKLDQELIEVTRKFMDMGNSEYERVSARNILGRIFRQYNELRNKSYPAPLIKFATHGSREGVVFFCPKDNDQIMIGDWITRVNEGHYD